MGILELHYRYPALKFNLTRLASSL